MANPRIALDAILADKETEVKDYKLFPITLGRYALLELIESPLADPKQKFTMATILPTLFIVLNDMSVLKKYNSKNIDDLKADAMVWAESNIKTNDVPELVKIIIDQLVDINKAAPVPGTDPEKKQ